MRSSPTVTGEGEATTATPSSTLGATAIARLDEAEWFGAATIPSSAVTVRVSPPPSRNVVGLLR